MMNEPVKIDVDKIIKSIKNMFATLEERLKNGTLSPKEFQKFTSKLMARLENLDMQESKMTLKLEKIKQISLEIDELIRESESKQVKGNKYLYEKITDQFGNLTHSVEDILVKNSKNYENSLNNLNETYSKTSSNILDNINSMYDLLKEFNNITPAKIDLDEQTGDILQKLKESTILIQKNSEQSDLKIAEFLKTSFDSVSKNSEQNEQKIEKSIKETVKILQSESDKNNQKFNQTLKSSIDSFQKDIEQLTQQSNSSIRENLSKNAQQLMQSIKNSSDITIKSSEKQSQQTIGIIRENFEKNGQQIIQNVKGSIEILNKNSEKQNQQVKGFIQENTDKQGHQIVQSLKGLITASQENTRARLAGLDVKFSPLATENKSLENTKKIIEQINGINKLISQIEKGNLLASIKNIEQKLGDLKDIIGNDPSIKIISDTKSIVNSIISDGEKSIPAIRKDTQLLLKGMKEEIPQKKDIAGLMNSIGNLNKICEINIPQKIDALSKETSQRFQDTFLSLSAEKENLLKIQEKLISLEKISGASIKQANFIEFKTNIEKLVNQIRQELMSNLSTILKSTSKTEENEIKIIEKIRILDLLAGKIDEIGKFLSEDLYQRMDGKLVEISASNSFTNTELTELVKKFELLVENTAKEKSLQEIKKFTSLEAYKELVNSIKLSIIPEIMEKLKSKPGIEYFDKNISINNEANTRILSNLESNNEIITNSNNKLEDLKSKVTGLAEKDDFLKFQEIIRSIVETQIPLQLEKMLADVAKQESIVKQLDNFGIDLKNLIKTDALIEETSKQTSNVMNDFKNSTSVQLAAVSGQLKQILNNTSSDNRDTLLDHIQSILSRTAKEESILKLNEQTLSSFGEMEENFKKTIKTVNQNERTANEIIQAMNTTVTQENLADFGQLIFEEIGKQITSKFDNLSKYTAKEQTLENLSGILNDNLKDMPKGDELIEIKSGQDKLTKSFIKVAGLIKGISDSATYHETQINNLSEKVSLLFEFIKRVSGV